MQCKYNLRGKLAPAVKTKIFIQWRNDDNILKGKAGTIFKYLNSYLHGLENINMD